MVRYGVRSGEYRAGLTVLALTVAEEERVACRVAVSETAGLSDEAAVHHHSVLDAAVAADYEIRAYNSVAYICRRLFFRDYASVD